MHLVSGSSDRLHDPLYQFPKSIARPGTLPDIFHKLRVHKNLSCASLSKLLRVSERYIRDIESGTRFSSLRYCLLCADLFGANPNWVKSKYANEAVFRYSVRLRCRLGLCSSRGVS
jgi:transcriptional regulator with XRE-family HTH domain